MKNEKEIKETEKRIAELEAEILEERKLMDNTIVKKWSIFSKGFSYDKAIKIAKTTSYVKGYDFQSKIFVGTERGVYDFIDELEKEIDGFNLKDVREIQESKTTI